MVGFHTYSDEQLLALLKEADQQAFEELYARYWKRMFALAYHKLKSRQDAEDIVHDIFASIWMRRSELHIQSLEAYLATAVKYKVLEYINRATHQSLPASEETIASLATTLPSDQLEQQLLARLVEEKIQSLPEKCRIVFQQSRVAGKSNPEIAKDLNISRKAVEKHISNALRQLRHSLKDFFSGIFSL